MVDFSQEIARLTLASIGGILAPTGCQYAALHQKQPVLYTQNWYPFPPLALFLGLLFIYSVIVIALFVWCSFVSSPTFGIQATGEKLRTVSLAQLARSALYGSIRFQPVISFFTFAGAY